MPHESSSDAKAAKSQHAAQRRQPENALLCKWQGVDKRSARDIPDCAQFDFQLSSWSCLMRARRLPRRPQTKPDSSTPIFHLVLSIHQLGRPRTNKPQHAAQRRQTTRATLCFNSDKWVTFKDTISFCIRISKRQVTQNGRHKRNSLSHNTLRSHHQNRGLSNSPGGCT